MAKNKTNARDFAPTKRALKLTDFSSNTDANGSYTGTPSQRGEQPEQDADDL